MLLLLSELTSKLTQAAEYIAYQTTQLEEANAQIAALQETATTAGAAGAGGSSAEMEGGNICVCVLVFIVNVITCVLFFYCNVCVLVII